MTVIVIQVPADRRDKPSGLTNLPDCLEMVSKVFSDKLSSGFAGQLFRQKLFPVEQLVTLSLYAHKDFEIVFAASLIQNPRYRSELIRKPELV